MVNKWTERCHADSRAEARDILTTVGSSPVTLPNANYDDAGSLRTLQRDQDSQDQFTYDAWNRVVTHRLFRERSINRTFTSLGLIAARRLRSSGSQRRSWLIGVSGRLGSSWVKKRCGSMS